ncbi:MAG: TRAP transporter large permease [Burkholderiales bacterium]
MSNETLAGLEVLGFVVLLLAGVPVGFAIAAAGILFGFLGFGHNLFSLVPLQIYGMATNYTLLAVPLFVFMGVLLEKSRIAEEMLDVMGHLAGKVRGGMAIGIVVIGILMGAATGIVGATVVTISVLCLPTLLKRGYDKGLACGTICASGTLGQIIPPSLILILLADLVGESIGTLFAAALLPGILLGSLYIAYILLLARFRPGSAPPIPIEERAQVTRRELSRRALKGLAPPILLIVAVLGSIMGGIAAPTEAASMGALGSLLIVMFSGRFSLKVLRDTLRGTLNVNAMIMLILFGSRTFSVTFRGLNGDELIDRLLGSIPGGYWGTILFLMGVLFLLGFFMEWIEICYIVLPLFLPFFVREHTNMVWLATVICANLQTSFLTPPFGWALFFIKGVAPPEVTTGDIYRGVIPFIVVQLIGLALVIAFPQISLWLPTAIGWIK